MITKQQALALRYCQELHYTGKQQCEVSVGLRGGKTVKIIYVRVSGKCQIWKTRPDEFRVPVKYGLYESYEINHKNGADFHLSNECPLLDPAKPH